MKNLVLAFLLSMVALPVFAAEVSRAVFTEAVVEREPVGKVDRLKLSAERVFFFTELRDFAGQRVSHRWMRNGEVASEIPFAVGADRWRVWSSKTLQPDLAGEWSVVVVNDAGDVLARHTLMYGEPKH